MNKPRILDFGVQNLNLYKLNETAQTYSQAINQPGLTTFTNKENQEATDVYADNQVHKTVLAIKTLEGAITLLQVDDDTKTNFLGKHKNENGSLTDGNSKSRLGCSYVTTWVDGDNEQRYRIKVIYDIMFGAEEETDETTTDGVTETTHELPYTGKVSNFIKDDIGNKVSKLEFNMPKGTTIEDLEAVLVNIPMPTDPIVNFEDATGTINRIVSIPAGLEVETTLALNDATKATLDVFESADLETVVQQIELDASATVTTQINGLIPEESYAVFLKSNTGKSLSVDLGIAGANVPAFVEATGSITIESQDATSVTGSYLLTLNDATDGDVHLVVTDNGTSTEVFNQPAVAGGANGTIPGLTASAEYTVELINTVTETVIDTKSFTTSA